MRARHHLLYKSFVGGFARGPDRTRINSAGRSIPDCTAQGFSPSPPNIDQLLRTNENMLAPAHEIQDLCNGHPEQSGKYHYHSWSDCIATEHHSLAGYMLDGFGIFSPTDEKGNFIRTIDLDECHGHTHSIQWNGKTVEFYHYHFTLDYPHTIGCFKGTPVSIQSSTSSSPPPSKVQPSGENAPPSEAVGACNGKSAGSNCSFNAPLGSVNGKCQTIDGTLACVP